MRPIKNTQASYTESKTSSKRNESADTKSADQTVEVLYQKLGDRWYAFSLIEDEVFFGSITQSEIDELEGTASGMKEAGIFPAKSTGSA